MRKIAFFVLLAIAIPASASKCTSASIIGSGHIAVQNSTNVTIVLFHGPNDDPRFWQKQPIDASTAIELNYGSTRWIAVGIVLQGGQKVVKKFRTECNGRYAIVFLRGQIEFAELS